jgi:hypothetical protein
LTLIVGRVYGPAVVVGHEPGRSAMDEDVDPREGMGALMWAFGAIAFGVSVAILIALFSRG